MAAHQILFAAAIVTAGALAASAQISGPRPLPEPTTAQPASPECLARFDAVGLPRARGDLTDEAHTIVCRRGFLLSYNCASHDPDWVMEHLTADDLKGPARRSNKFLRDSALSCPDVDNAVYAKSGYDRGHQAPAGDAKFDQKVMDDSFFFSNMAPQVGLGFNRGAWAYLEETVRSWVLCGGKSEVYVITGPIYGSSTPSPIGKSGPQVTIPNAFFKIIYDVNSSQAVAFELPNKKIGSTIDLQQYAVPISQVETDTGLDFFGVMAQRRQQQLESEAGVAWQHIAECPSTAD